MTPSSFVSISSLTDCVGGCNTGQGFYRRLLSDSWKNCRSCAVLYYIDFLHTFYEFLFLKICCKSQVYISCSEVLGREVIQSGSCYKRSRQNTKYCSWKPVSACLTWKMLDSVNDRCRQVWTNNCQQPIGFTCLYINHEVQLQL